MEGPLTRHSHYSFVRDKSKTLSGATLADLAGTRGTMPSRQICGSKPESRHSSERKTRRYVTSMQHALGNHYAEARLPD